MSSSICLRVKGPPVGAAPALLLPARPLPGARLGAAGACRGARAGDASLATRAGDGERRGCLGGDVGLERRGAGEGSSRTGGGDAC